MRKLFPSHAILAMTAVVALALPGFAAAETVVPPGNSAATQYTETFPTSGGNVEVNEGISGERSPHRTLPKQTAEALEDEGPEGRAAAQLAADTAPAATGESEAGSGGAGGAANGGGGKGGGAAQDGGGAGQGQAQGGSQAGGETVAVEVPSGSSGFGEVVSHLTGSDAGEMGALLPLLLFAALIWAGATAWRRHQAGQRTAP
jgi:hypothetical protein